MKTEAIEIQMMKHKPYRHKRILKYSIDFDKALHHIYIKLLLKMTPSF